ncbi:unnamed protein product [Rhodiola kirilowii]
MEARVLTLTCAPPSSSSQSNFTIKRVSIHAKFAPFNLTSSSSAGLTRLKCKEQLEIEGLPKEYYDDEWQAQQREKTKEFHRQRKAEEDEEERKVKEYREIGTRLNEYPEEEVKQARRLVASFLMAEEEIEQRIEEAAEKGELTEIVLLVIWNRLDLARRDEEKDAIRSLDLLYRRVEMEILKSEASPAMRLLNELLNLHDGYNNELWLKECKKLMVDTFPREDPFSLVMPAGFDIDNIDMQKGPFRPPPELEDPFLRIDFIREVNELVQEVRDEQGELETAEGFDPESIANRLKQQEKQRTIHQVETLLELAMSLEL